MRRRCWPHVGCAPHVYSSGVQPFAIAGARQQSASNDLRCTCADKPSKHNGVLFWAAAALWAEKIARNPWLNPWQNPWFRIWSCGAFREIAQRARATNFTTRAMKLRENTPYATYTHTACIYRHSTSLRPRCAPEPVPEPVSEPVSGPEAWDPWAARRRAPARQPAPRRPPRAATQPETRPTRTTRARVHAPGHHAAHPLRARARAGGITPRTPTPPARAGACAPSEPVTTPVHTPTLQNATHPQHSPPFPHVLAEIHMTVGGLFIRSRLRGVQPRCIQYCAAYNRSSFVPGTKEAGLSLGRRLAGTPSSG